MQESHTVSLAVKINWLTIQQRARGLVAGFLQLRAAWIEARRARATAHSLLDLDRRALDDIGLADQVRSAWEARRLDRW
jgi:uncharacterized protein YjiS (DUF1127 family)